MFKKPLVISLEIVLAVVVLFLALPSSDIQAGANNKKALAERLWKKSGHADKDSTAFNYWNTAGAVPTGCAKCHSTLGFKDFLGADGSAGGVVDKTAAIGTTVECDVCHTDKEKGILRKNPDVLFPSGVTVTGLGPDGICMECHQGRTAKATIDTKITGAKVPNNDTSSTVLSFSNIHYFAAAASQMGTVVKGGYEYAGKTYDARFSHITGYNACNTCHNPHSLEVNLKACNTCHVGVMDPKDIRYLGSCTDYDGDGDIEEGLYYEIRDIMEKQLDTIKAYARAIVRKPIAYDEHTHPYWYFDTNGNGIADSSEVVSTNAYNAFTVRLLKAAYNYQVAKKDPNNYAHGGKYIIQLLYDSIEDMNGALAAPTDLSEMHRDDEGHFDGAGEAWRHWDADGQVSASCAKCHSATGLAYYLANGTNQAEPIANGMLCTTCHTSPPALRQAPVVSFVSSGLTANLGDSSNLCMICHQGRESKASVDTYIAGRPAGSTLGFRNVHYFPAAGVFMGTEAKVGYEFSGKTYAGRKNFANHSGRFTTCIECHMSSKGLCEDCNKESCNHNVEPEPADCVLCHGADVSQPHPGADPEHFEFDKIRPATVPDYDADGNKKESLKEEIEGLEDALYAVMQTYAVANKGFAILYGPNNYPYWFKDLNGNGILDTNEAVSANSFPFDAKLLRTAFNMQMSKKEPAGFIHNSRYIAQLLVDSIQHLGGDISKYTWR
jgi:hypothetical protein